MKKKSMNCTKRTERWTHCLLFIFTLLVATNSCGEDNTSNPALQQDLKTISEWNAGVKVS